MYIKLNICNPILAQSLVNAPGLGFLFTLLHSGMEHLGKLTSAIDILSPFRAKAHKPAINYKHLREATSLLMVLQLPVNKFIIYQLAMHPEGMIVSDLVHLAKIDVSEKKKQSVISGHLAGLRKRGIVSYKKEGKYHTYALCNKKLANVAAAVNKFSNK